MMAIPQESQSAQGTPCHSATNAPVMRTLTPKESRYAWYLPDAPDKLPPFNFAYRGKRLAAEIKAQCRSCTGWDVRTIRNCVQQGCPMWELRPFQKQKVDAGSST